MSDDFELLGAPHAARDRGLRARTGGSGPQHPDFTLGDDDPAANEANDANEPAVPARDAAVDFAHVGHLVNRMRAAFFSSDS